MSFGFLGQRGQIIVVGILGRMVAQNAIELGSSPIRKP
ncbi:MAG: hypothetical protein CSYNP_02802 [Syntrophus sp. SKADARSKE-3]|nr:hypothetical protein [Syntrophus sp. SKADARSKE-3]